MNLESPKVSVEKSATYLFEALSQVTNFEKLMPDSIAKFEVIGDDAFIFGLKGMPEIKLKMKEKVPTSKVVLGAASDKLPFTLTGNIIHLSETSSEVQLIFDVERDHYQWMNVGWEGLKRVYRSIVHFDIREDKIWLQQNLTDLNNVYGNMLKAMRA